MTSGVSQQPAVLVVSASMGAGHDGVCHELARRLRLQGVPVETVDYLSVLPLGFGRLYRRVYTWQLRWAPTSYELLYAGLDRFGGLTGVARVLCALGAARLRRLIRRGQYRLVISTYPMATQALGRLRSRHQIEARAVTFLTDADVHSLWLHAGIDRNLTVWPATAETAGRRVDVPSQAVGPVLPPAYSLPVSQQERAAARRALGLGDGPVALVVAGSWGVGEVLSTAAALHASGAALPVVLCGRNDKLKAQIEQSGVGLAVGWTSDVRGVLAASDVVIHNAGGLSCLEAHAAGIPVVGYACIPGHGRRNAAAMASSGTAAFAADADDLVDVVSQLAQTEAGRQMAARARALFREDPTQQLVDLTNAPAPVTASRPAAVTRRVAVVLASASLSWMGVTVGVAQATVHGHGVARGDGALYLAVEIDSHTAADRRTARVLAVGRASLAVSAGRRALPMDSVRNLAAAGVGIVGVDHAVGVHNPVSQVDSLTDTADLVREVTGDARPPVAVLHPINPVELTAAWTRHIRLARPDMPTATGRPAGESHGRQVILDERGRTMDQITADLAALDRPGHRPQPMCALWSRG